MKIEQLQQQRNQLRETLRNSFNETELLTTMEKMEEIDTEISRLKIPQMLDNANRKYSALREAARQAWEAEQPTEDPSNADGSFHKVKIKKYPKLQALQYASIRKFKDGKIIELSINGNTFYMYRTKYEYGKPDEYTRPETFEDFLNLNSIPAQDFTQEQFDQLSEKLNALNAEIDKHIKAYEIGLKKLKISSFNYCGLIRQENTNFYKYTPKTGY